MREKIKGRNNKEKYIFKEKWRIIFKCPLLQGFKVMQTNVSVGTLLPQAIRGEYEG